jgi:hypothetical protein
VLLVRLQSLLLKLSVKSGSRERLLITRRSSGCPLNNDKTSNYSYTRYILTHSSSTEEHLQCRPKFTCMPPPAESTHIYIVCVCIYMSNKKYIKYILLRGQVIWCARKWDFIWLITFLLRAVCSIFTSCSLANTYIFNACKADNVCVSPNLLQSWFLQNETLP